ncbi:MAG: cobyrinic acid a,c-diamide synthase [Chlamydiae bacterium RIFCSPHIGHO2_12_FULL_44_59]|nr:MAG: cobyrinic acid a,c-diamide synthase [Chlamydiae bacterium RIFCSPHIGHO2_01_FULL_44_39]OGN56993.1 MAG: cobyrinic acid a,c-diamide synthase [Chlamydiae bacterium RIFCSPHIGHO2_02_FULL_45_9]OGN59546.1 MAG: cobyrinic acid a,c-diamide synthase [Chlamydiae bacterium RIFCSPHIGHO2_12_FULL_44_59]OGN67291.1 MAG: cobyrinic acid a,c-diamide synthase [Chlamydiae bacterium RIFCSPLOWO2_01_FULL_44_52]OGN68712.1 MAG: cobyrinic acid a,c-diamide synthase [Chlamydiae bacterium RIFCSPLOWO2_02_FULL_45_22]OGN6
MESFFIAATGQNIGKTTTCLGLVSGLKQRVKTVGFMKPVGQEHVETETGEHVDKDVVLFKHYFKLKFPYEAMSPVLFPKGFTRDFLDKRVDHEDMVQKIHKGFAVIQATSQVTVIEGTGHTGVGSIVNLNNAQVAKLLGLPMILIASGGLGSSIDQLSLNFANCEKYQVRVAGVILNRVLEEKRDMILNYVSLALKRWNIPLLGAIPYSEFLNMPSMRDFESLFQTELLCGNEFALRHFEHMRIAASSVEVYRTTLAPHQLIITPAGREDIILATLTRFWDLKISHPEEDLHTGLILTGKMPPKDSLVQQMKTAKIPVIYVPLSSFAVMKMINNYSLKIRNEDLEKIHEAVKIVENHIDFETLEKALRKSNP